MLIYVNLCVILANQGRSSLSSEFIRSKYNAAFTYMYLYKDKKKTLLFLFKNLNLKHAN